MPRPPITYAQGILSPHRAIIVAVLAALSVVVACGGLDSSLTDLEVGDCVKDPDLSVEAEEVGSLDHVDCSEANTLRVTEVFDITGYDDYPGDETIDSIVSSRCSIDATILFPTNDTWNQADDREVVCFETATGSDELTRAHCEEVSDVKPGNIIVFDESVSVDDRQICASLLAKPPSVDDSSLDAYGEAFISGYIEGSRSEREARCVWGVIEADLRGDLDFWAGDTSLTAMDSWVFDWIEDENNIASGVIVCAP